MGIQTTDEARWRRDLAAAHHRAANDGVVHCAPRARPWRMRNGWTMVTQSKAKTNGLPCCAICKRSFNPFVFFRRVPMPTIRVELFEGRTPEQKRNLVAALTDAAVKTLGGSPESVDVLLFDIKPSDWSTGGVLWSEKKPGS